MNKDLIICDIDGVLANCEHRLHYLVEKDYGSFYGDRMLNDELIKPGVRLLYYLWSQHFDNSTSEYIGNRVIFLTGRPEHTRPITGAWMKKYMPLTLSRARLLMRKDDDYRPSPRVKVERLKECGIDFEAFETVYFIDDDPKNVKAVCGTFPEIVGITFGVKRMEES